MSAIESAPFPQYKWGESWRNATALMDVITARAQSAPIYMPRPGAEDGSGALPDVLVAIVKRHGTARVYVTHPTDPAVRGYLVPLWDQERQYWGANRGEACLGQSPDISVACNMITGAMAES